MPAHGRTRGILAVLGASIALTVLLYRPTIGYGFYYDDYHFVRPFTTAEVAASFHGPWDSAGIETAYYRPLTICLYAARFALFGLNAHAQHVASLAAFALAATLFGLFVTQISASRMAGVGGAAVFVVHPGMPYSAVAWITNQMHLAELLVVLTALLYWFGIRYRSARSWMPLLVLQIAAFLIKEDGVMLVPAILALHLLRRRLCERDLPRPPWSFLAAAAIVGAGLLLLRSAALHGAPSPRIPGFDQAWSNWTRGIKGAFTLTPARRPWQPAASWFVMLVPLAAVAVSKRVSPAQRFTMAAGAAIGLLFVLPFAFIIKAEQLHLVTMGACLLLTGAICGLLHAAAGMRAARPAIAVVALAGLAAMGAVARDITRDFEPSGPIVLHTDRIVDAWAAVPPELREYLASKRTDDRSSTDPDPSRAVPFVAFGMHGYERTPDGARMRWMAGPEADVFVRRDIRLVSFSARHERGAFGEAAHVRIEADGTSIADAILDDGEWHRIDVSLRPRARLGFGAMHRIRIRLDHAWVPAAIIPGSSDRRTLGLQIGDFQTR